MTAKRQGADSSDAICSGLPDIMSLIGIRLIAIRPTCGLPSEDPAGSGRRAFPDHSYLHRIRTTSDDSGARHRVTQRTARHPGARMVMGSQRRAVGLVPPPRQSPIIRHCDELPWAARLLGMPRKPSFPPSSDYLAGEVGHLVKVSHTARANGSLSGRPHLERPPRWVRGRARSGWLPPPRESPLLRHRDELPWGARVLGMPRKPSPSIGPLPGWRSRASRRLAARPTMRVGRPEMTAIRALQVHQRPLVAQEILPVRIAVSAAPAITTAGAVVAARARQPRAAAAVGRRINR